MKARKGTTEVDDAFLGEIERWRDLLAKNIALRNSSLNVRELNYAVQMTIDRIIFLRICEDRGAERDEQLKDEEKKKKKKKKKGGGDSKIGGDIYAGRATIYSRGQTRATTLGLFHFKNEKEQSRCRGHA